MRLKNTLYINKPKGVYIMWNCKHCKKEFDFDTTSKKANHSRWCESNPKRNDTSNLVKAQEKINETKLGKLKDFEVTCYNCGSIIIVNEREKKHPIKEKYYCSKNCANSQGGKAKANLDEKNGNMNYVTLAKRYNEEKCIVCGFDKIISVHHINENHNDNRKENLVILCPNHHHMFHSKHRKEIESHINKYCEEKWGYSSSG